MIENTNLDLGNSFTLFVEHPNWKSIKKYV